MKISHKRSSVVDEVIKEIEKSFGKMMVTRGSKHTFVGIDINFTTRWYGNVVNGSIYQGVYRDI